MTESRDRTESDYVFPRGRKPGAKQQGQRTQQKRSSSRKGRMSNEALRSELEKTLTDVAFFASYADPFDGHVIRTAAPNIAGQWGELASKNDAVRKALEGFIAGSAWGGAVSSLLIPALLILSHHGAIPTPPFMREQSTGAQPSSQPNGTQDGAGEPSTATVTHLRAPVPETPPVTSDDLDDSPTTGHVRV